LFSRHALINISVGIAPFLHHPPRLVSGFRKPLSRAKTPSNSVFCQQTRHSPPTVKQHLAAFRILFDWLVAGHVIDVNPAHAASGPKYVVKKGKTPVLNAEEARALLDSIDISMLTGLRDRALIGVIVYTFARVNAVISIVGEEFYPKGGNALARVDSIFA